jgi:Holliday junction resolvase RusA-like endonuclease
MKWAVTVWGQPPTTNKMYSAKMRSMWRDGVRFNVPQMVKNPKVEKYQTDAVRQIQSAKPSRWKPDGFVRLTFRLYLARNIDADNTLKALTDAIQIAIGVNDSWFLPCVESKEWGLSPRDARVEIEVEDIPGSPSQGPVPSRTGPLSRSSTSSRPSRTR